MKRYTEQERKEQVKQYLVCGISQQDFCRQAGISSVTLRRWCRRYGGALAATDAGTDARRSAAHTQQWVPVVCAQGSGFRLQAGLDPLMGAASGAGGLGYSLVVAGARLEVPSGFALQEVTLLWQLLSAATSALSASGRTAL
jgi:hypothetical protein